MVAPGENDLSTLLSTLTTTLQPGVYVFSTVAASQPIPASVKPRMIFQEAEGTTLVLTLKDAEDHAIAYEFRSRMITLNVHSSLEAIGFLAVITTRLAKKAMGCNPVSGFYHDHLFVPEGREGEAVEELAALAREARDGRFKLD